MKSLLISEQTLKKYTLINDNVDGSYILPAIQIVQDVDLFTLIGKALLNRLTELVDSGEIYNNQPYKLLLDEYITPYMCWQVMSQIQIGLNYKFSNSGVIGQDDDRKNRLDYKNAQLLMEQYKHYADAYANKMKDFLCTHSSDYPEYSRCLDHSTKNDVEPCGIFFGNAYKCSKR